MRQTRFLRSHAKPHVRGQMNKTEAAYAEHLSVRMLAGEVLGFQFEAIRLRLADNTNYCPDFLVQLADTTLELHEVKACKSDGSIISEDASKIKLKVAAEKYPMFGFVLCGKLPKSGGWRFDEV